MQAYICLESRDNKLCVCVCVCVIHRYGLSGHTDSFSARSSQVCDVDWSRGVARRFRRRRDVIGSGAAARPRNEHLSPLSSDCACPPGARAKQPTSQAEAKIASRRHWSARLNLAEACGSCEIPICRQPTIPLQACRRIRVCKTSTSPFNRACWKLQNFGFVYQQTKATRSRKLTTR